MTSAVTTIHRNDRCALAKVEKLLSDEGLNLDDSLDYTCGIYDDDDNLIATGSSFGPTLRCLAVDAKHRGKGLLNIIVTHLSEYQAQQGNLRLFVYTKADSAKFFESLGFYEVAGVEDKLSFLENQKGGFAGFLRSLVPENREGRIGAVVMNANPFTLGHLHLVERAADECAFVHLFVLSEIAGPLSLPVRWKLVKEGTKHLKNVYCHQTGPYLISIATFPSYFFKDRESTVRCHGALDVVLFGFIAKKLGITVRYMGSEPYSMVTRIYNTIMKEKLPRMGIEWVELPRLEKLGQPISASTVRKAIHDGRMDAIRPLVPKTTWNFFTSPQGKSAVDSIRMERCVTHY